MVTRITLASTLALLLAGSAVAQTQVIVQDDFEGYADTNAFLQQWVPTIGLGTAPSLSSDQLAGVLTTDPFSNPALFPGVEGVAVDHVGATASVPGQVNQWGGVIDQTSNQNPDFTINPSESQSVFLSADIFVGNSGNERMTVGLRSTVAIPDGTDTDTYPDANSANIFEMGVYNANPTVLGIPGTVQESAGYAFRIINFGTASPPLPGQPNWQYFELPAALDRTDDADEIVNIGDIGAGWHRYTATFTPTEITVSIDMFRDGFKNIRDEAGDIVVGSGEEGVDAELTFPVATLPAGFNNLRLGGPSGLSSAGSGAMGFDNILLQLQAADVVPGDDADFDADGDVDGADFLAWQRNLGISDGSATLAQGDANADGNVTQADLDAWKQQFSAGGSPVAAIPEPSTVALGALAMLAGLAASRRR